MFTFGAGRKYGKTRKLPRATSAAGIAPTRAWTAWLTESHWSAVATATTGSVVPRWKRNPSPTAWNVAASGSARERRASSRPAIIAWARRTEPPNAPVCTSSSVAKTSVFIPRRGRSSVERNIRPTHV